MIGFGSNAKPYPETIFERIIEVGWGGAPLAVIYHDLAGTRPIAGWHPANNSRLYWDADGYTQERLRDGDEVPREDEFDAQNGWTKTALTDVDLHDFPNLELVFSSGTVRQYEIFSASFTDFQPGYDGYTDDFVYSSTYGTPPIGDVTWIVHNSDGTVNHTVLHPVREAWTQSDDTAEPIATVWHIPYRNVPIDPYYSTRQNVQIMRFEFKPREGYFLTDPAAGAQYYIWQEVVLLSVPPDHWDDGFLNKYQLMIYAPGKVHNIFLGPENTIVCKDESGVTLTPTYNQTRTIDFSEQASPFTPDQPQLRFNSAGWIDTP
jgi:hypothetical protein